MNLPDLLNSNNLFLKLNGLNKDNDLNFIQIKEETFSRGTSSLLNLIRIQELNENCKAEFNLFKKQLNIKDPRIVYSSITLGFLLNEITPLLTNIRLLQNLALKIVRSFEDKELPKSINDYFKKPTKFVLKDGIHKELEKHWTSTGKLLKEYRDIDQHYTWLIDRYFIETSPNGNIILEFPDNPEINSPKNFTYLKQINGLEFLKKSFHEIHDCIENISLIYGASPAQHNSRISLSQLGVLTPPMERTLTFYYTANYFNDKNGDPKLYIKGMGADQMADMRLSFREYFLDEEGLENAKKLYK